MKSVTIRDTDALEKFIHYFNIAYPDWEIYRDSSTPLRPSHVEFGTVSHCAGRCGSSRVGTVTFDINPEWWDKNTEEAQLGLLIHELSHVKHGNHRPAFWEQVITVYHRLEDRSEAVTEVVDGELDWDSVVEWIVKDPKTKTVDNRAETVFERRKYWRNN